MSERLEKAKQKRADRVKLIAENAALIAKAKAESRDLTKEESAEWDRRDADVEKLKKEYEEIEAAADRESRQAELDREMQASQGRRAGAPDQRSGDSPEKRAQEYARKRDIAFRVFAQKGPEHLTPEEREIFPVSAISGQDLPGDIDPRLRGTAHSGITLRLAPVPMEPQRRLVWNPATRRVEERANEPQAAYTDQFGGYTVPNAPMGPLDQAILQFGGIRQANVTVLRTPTGANLPIPANDDTSNKGAILAENTQETGATPLAFTQVNLGAFKYKSGFVLASYEFLQDTSIGAPEAWLSRRLGERLGRIFSDHDTKGSNVGQPYGVAWGAFLGKTAASATAVTYAEIIDLIHSVDPAYRANAAQLMFHDNTLAALKKLTDSQNRPVFLPSMDAREPDRVNGYQYVINQSMDTMAAGKHSILFGDFSHFYLRDVTEITVLRLQERFADYFQVGFIAFARHDARIVDAGTHPIKYLRHPAS